MPKILLLALVLPLCLPAQRSPHHTDSLRVLRQARADVALLCSDSLAGRGVAGGGQLRAAHWLARQFQAIGLHTATGSATQNQADYLQSFNYDLNLFDAPQVIWDGKKLQPGTDYLIAPESGPVRQNASTRVWHCGHGLPTDWQQLTDNASYSPGDWVLIRPGLPPQHQLPDSLARILSNDAYKLRLALEHNPTGGVVLSRPKLTHGLAPYALPMPVLVLREQLAVPGPHQLRASWSQNIVQAQGHNVVGVWPGRSDSCIVIGAHYDHLGRLGTAVFRGASDNASGTAWLLALARRVVAGPKLPYTIVFIAFGAEEAGLIGSFHYVKNPWRGHIQLTKYMLNVDLMGFGEKGWMAVGGIDYPQHYARVQAQNQGTTLVAPLRARRNAPISDHYPFTQMGVPALFFYTEGGPGFYHDVLDKPQTLGYAAFYRSLRLVQRMIAE